MYLFVQKSTLKMERGRGRVSSDPTPPPGHYSFLLSKSDHIFALQEHSEQMHRTGDQKIIFICFYGQFTSVILFYDSTSMIEMAIANLQNNSFERTSMVLICNVVSNSLLHIVWASLHKNCLKLIPLHTIRIHFVSIN